VVIVASREEVGEGHAVVIPQPPRDEGAVARDGIAFHAEQGRGRVDRQSLHDWLAEKPYRPMVATRRMRGSSVDVDDPENQQQDQRADQGHEYRAATPEPVGEEEHVTRA